MIITPENDRERDLLHRRLPAIRHILSCAVIVHLACAGASAGGRVNTPTPTIKSKSVPVADQGAQQGSVRRQGSAIEPLE
jgi:hypothetical protein